MWCHCLLNENCTFASVPGNSKTQFCNKCIFSLHCFVYLQRMDLDSDTRDTFRVWLLDSGAEQKVREHSYTCYSRTGWWTTGAGLLSKQSRLRLFGSTDLDEVVGEIEVLRREAGRKFGRGPLSRWPRTWGTWRGRRSWLLRQKWLGLQWVPQARSRQEL